MNEVKKLLVLLLTVAVVSLSLTGCKHKDEHPSEGDHPSKKAPSEEHPAGEHPK